MTIKAELILPSDVQLIPVRDLAPDVRAKLDGPGDDFAVTRLRSRASSHIVDDESAALLLLFRSPMRIVDAVLSFADQRGLDPETTLEQSYPLLYRLWNAKLLVPARSSKANPIESLLKVDAVIEGYRLLRSVQVFEDTEVFLGRSTAGDYAAVKVFRQNDSEARDRLNHESTIMGRIKQRIAPDVLKLVNSDCRVALITEWIFGLNVGNSAAGMRGRREERNEKALLTLCIEIAQTFADLHCSGVLHGDVHPRNIIVEPGGSVRVIDFGLSKYLGRQEGNQLRGGVAFYMDPQLAEARRNHKHAPLTPEAEQYSIAALLYQLWTGTHYLDWKLERNEMLRQIVEDDPVPFQERNIPGWPELEQVFRRALHKKADRRFATISALTDSLRALLPQAESRDRVSNRQKRQRPPEKELLDRALRRYDVGGITLLEGPILVPLASITYGAAGIAYSIYRISQIRESAKLLALADIWTQRAYALSSHEQAFYDTGLGITREMVGDVSLFHSNSGVHCVRSLVSIALGDFDTATRAIQDFIAHSQYPCTNLDLTLGTGSILLGLAELIESLPAASLIDLEPIRKRGNEVLSHLIQILRSEGIATSTKISSLGVAHGWGGFIFAALRWTKAVGLEPEPVIREKLHELSSLAEPHGGGLQWPVHNATKSSTFMHGWCNGTAGHVLLFALAYDVFRDHDLLEIVERGAESVWTSELQLGTLCCGLAGMGYALIAAYRATGSEVWLERAQSLVCRAATDSSPSFFRDSLYKGAVGVAMLAEDLKQPATAAMPLFEPTS